MIDRSESHLIARERRNRGGSEDGDAAPRATRRSGRLRDAHDPLRGARIEPTVGGLSVNPTRPAR